MTVGSDVQLNRILVVKLAGIGDMLTTFPALEALRTRYPQAEITALVTPQTASMVGKEGLVDHVIPLDKYLFDEPAGFFRSGALVGLARLIGRLRGARFDAAILLHHLQGWPGVAKYALLMLASGARLRVGLDDGRGKFLNLAARDMGFGDRHEVDYWLDVVGLLDAIHPEPIMRLSRGEEEEAFAAMTWEQLGLPRENCVVAIHPGTGSYSPVRRWHPGGFAAVVESLAGEGLFPVVVAGPGEEGLARMVMEGVSVPSVLLRDVPSPRHLAAVLSRCRLFIGNDSGVMHMAVAAGVPVVALFGPSNHRAWGPYDPGGRKSRIVRVDLACSPCMYRGQSLGLRYGCGTMNCLRRIEPGMVVAAARDLLASTSGRHSGPEPA